MEASVQRSLSKIKSVISCRLKAVLQSKCQTAAAWKFPSVCLINTWWLAFNSAIPKVKKKKRRKKRNKKKRKKVKNQLSFCSIISLSGHRANWCSYGWPQLILHSLTAFGLLLVFQLTAIWKLWKPASISCSQVPFPPPLSIMALCNHSCVCIAEPSGPSITGGRDCSGNWQPCCHLAKKTKTFQ